MANPIFLGSLFKHLSKAVRQAFLQQRVKVFVIFGQKKMPTLRYLDWWVGGTGPLKMFHAFLLGVFKFWVWVGQNTNLFVTQWAPRSKPKRAGSLPCSIRISIRIAFSPYTKLSLGQGPSGRFVRAVNLQNWPPNFGGFFGKLEH